ncbi:hypothetical protein JKP88DRAFT_251657 [Tribonema minus]|uniref:Uncharacterized protein n=1 Tax=Tribonema minus TaxID=303371 RepID=A0A835ZII6_9STRA|nr:hypothetical protein JKP88DRAFT_251657 [Tribonema minus]
MATLYKVLGFVLTENKYYITTTPLQQVKPFLAHFFDGGKRAHCPWTQRYTPVGRLMVDKETDNPFQLEAEVRLLMHQRGMNNVRGGTAGGELHLTHDFLDAFNQSCDEVGLPRQHVEIPRDGVEQQPVPPHRFRRHVSPRGKGKGVDRGSKRRRSTSRDRSRSAFPLHRRRSPGSRGRESSPGSRGREAPPVDTRLSAVRKRTGSSNATVDDMARGGKERATSPSSSTYRSGAAAQGANPTPLDIPDAVDAHQADGGDSARSQEVPPAAAEEHDARGPASNGTASSPEDGEVVNDRSRRNRRTDETQQVTDDHSQHDDDQQDDEQQDGNQQDGDQQDEDQHDEQDGHQQDGDRQDGDQQYGNQQDGDQQDGNRHNAHYNVSIGRDGHASPRNHRDVGRDIRGRDTQRRNNSRNRGRGTQRRNNSRDRGENTQRRYNSRDRGGDSTRRCNNSRGRGGDSGQRRGNSRDAGRDIRQRRDNSRDAGRDSRQRRVSRDREQDNRARRDNSRNEVRGSRGESSRGQLSTTRNMGGGGWAGLAEEQRNEMRQGARTAPYPRHDAACGICGWHNHLEHECTFCTRCAQRNHREPDCRARFHSGTHRPLSPR